jgi:hypothetical protein
MRRNYEIYDPLDFLAEVTQHIPNKGEHQIWYYGLSRIFKVYCIIILNAGRPLSNYHRFLHAFVAV